jgi:hypothetical protein
MKELGSNVDVDVELLLGSFIGNQSSSPLGRTLADQEPVTGPDDLRRK